MAIAAASQRVGYVFLIDDKLAHWRLSVKASKSPALAARQAADWIADFKPHVVITEKVGPHSRKGERTRQLIAAISRVASDAKVNDVVVPRIQSYANKYEEAAALAERFPIIEPWRPKKPRMWESEPRNMIFFEALALTLPVIDPPDAAP